MGHDGRDRTLRPKLRRTDQLALPCLARAFCASSSCLKRAVTSVWKSGWSLLGSSGGYPPRGEAKVTSAPAFFIV
jgi:hypothetical protein